MLKQAPDTVIPDSIEVLVRPYDAVELALLQNLSCWTDIEAVMGSTTAGKVVTIPKEQFLVYSTFSDLDCSSLAELHSDASAQEVRLSRLAVAKGSYFNAKPTLVPNNHSKDAEEIGVALSLSVSDIIFGTSEMDWNYISIGKTKSFDYVASTGSFRPEIEAKGSFIDQSHLTPSTISNHKASIKGKKKDLGANQANSARIGMIAAIGKSGRPELRLVDPPVEWTERNPPGLKLLLRTAFLARWISFVSPRSSLAIALQQRLADLNSILNIEELNRRELVNGTGTTIDISPYDSKLVHSRFFATKSVVTDGPTGGWVVPVGKWLFFLGIMDDLLKLAVAQDFEAIREYSREPATVTKQVRCVFSRGRFDRLGLKKQVPSFKEEGGYVSFEAKGDLAYTAGGLVFGWLPFPEGN